MSMQYLEHSMIWSIEDTYKDMWIEMLYDVQKLLIDSKLMAIESDVTACRWKGLWELFAHKVQNNDKIGSDDKARYIRKATPRIVEICNTLGWENMYFDILDVNKPVRLDEVESLLKHKELVD